MERESAKIEWKIFERDYSRDSTKVSREDSVRFP